MKKICFIIPSLKAGGGSERIISELANYSASFDNFKVHLVLLIKDRHFYKISDKISVHEPDFNHSNHSRLVFSAKIIWYLRKETIDIAPDVILSFEEMYNSFVLLALLRLKIRIFISDRCQPESYWGIFHKVMKRIIYPTSYGIIAQTEMAKKILYKQIKHNNIIVIANPILDAYKPGTAKENIILNVGRLIKSKQHNVLLRIFAQTNNKGWKLIIAGDGPERDSLNSLCQSLKLSDQVQFVGNVKNIEDFYSRSKIFAFTSRSEGFPNALGEAMAALNAVISFNCPAGPEELIDDGINGFLVDLNDIETFKNRLQLLMDNESICHKFSVMAKKKIEEFSIEVIGKRYINTLLNENEQIY